MRIIADSNILLRAIVGDDPRQEKLAQAELAAAEGRQAGSQAPSSVSVSTSK